MTISQPDFYERFLDLHRQSSGFVMPNAWDGLSALLLKDAGFQALGTSSAALAFALDRLDGKLLPDSLQPATRPNPPKAFRSVRLPV